MSWDSTIATTKCRAWVHRIAWSPCSRFIAISLEDGTEVQILDGATLKTIGYLESGYPVHAIGFSPRGHSVTCVSVKPAIIISWDLQTGAPVSEIDSGDIQPAGEAHLIVHSACGTKIGVLFTDGYDYGYDGSAYGYDSCATVGTYDSITGTPYPTICIYDLLSGVPTFYRPIKELAGNTIWTLGECIQFVTLAPGSISIWEVGFTSKDPPTLVRSLPTPNGFNPDSFVFLPTLYQLVFTSKGAVLVWDAQHSKLLLNSADLYGHISVGFSNNFSSNGHFFACGTDGPDVYLWKESPTGYILHQILTPRATNPYTPLLSPNGQSIVVIEDDIIELWRTTGSSASPSGVLAPPPRHDKTLILGLSPDRSLAAIGRLAENTVKVLHLKFGTPWLVIDTGMKLSGLRMTEDSVIVVGDGKAVSWNLPVGDQGPCTMVNIGDGIQITTYNYSPFPEWTGTPLASLSPDLKYIAVTGLSETKDMDLNIYDTSTGQCLAGIKTRIATLWFTPDGCEVWGHQYGEITGWKIIKDSGTGHHFLEHFGPDKYPLGGCPWKPPHDYKVEEGWLFSPSRKRLLWIPHHWQADKNYSQWNGQLLAFLHHGLSDAVILELQEE